MIMTHSLFFSSSCLRGSAKITYPHKEPAQAGKMWSPVRQWSFFGGWRHLTVTAVLPLAQLSCHAWMYFFNRHQPPLTSRLPPPAPLSKPPEGFIWARYPRPCPTWISVSCETSQKNHQPQSSAPTYLTQKERPLPFISRQCYFFYSAAFRGLLCSRSRKYFTSQQFVQEALRHSSIFQPCQPYNKAWSLESSSESHEVSHCLGFYTGMYRVLRETSMATYTGGGCGLRSCL